MAPDARGCWPRTQTSRRRSAGGLPGGDCSWPGPCIPTNTMTRCRPRTRGAAPSPRGTEIGGARPNPERGPPR
eukprot:5920978-Lingulodinium_polyedra.AAC.1